MTDTTLDAPLPQVITIAARVEDARRTYGVEGTIVHALDGVTVGFSAGEFTSIMGPSGSGKSTLMHCMAGWTPSPRGRPSSATPTSRG